MLHSSFRVYTNQSKDLHILARVNTKSYRILFKKDNFVIQQLGRHYRYYTSEAPTEESKPSPSSEQLKKQILEQPGIGDVFSNKTLEDASIKSVLKDYDELYTQYLSSLYQEKNYKELQDVFEKFGTNNFLQGKAPVWYLKSVISGDALVLADKIHKLFPSDKSAGTSHNPLNVRVHYSKWSTIGSVLWMIFLFLTLIIMLSSLKGGSFGNILNKTFNPVDKGKVNITFADVMGNHEAKEDMMDLVEYLKNPDKFGNIKVPKGVLMAGPPGTGKTLLAKALAGEAGVPFIASSGSEFEEVFVGVGAKRIRTLFEEARKRAPCIIFIDEIDAVAGKRDLLKQSQMSLNQLLVELDGFNSRDGIIIIGATNRPETLDPAIVRPGRFDRKIFLSYPTIEERKEILDYYLKKHKIDEDVDPVTLSRQLAGMSGADIENMVNWAAMDTVKNDAPAITMHSLELALLNVVMGREKKTMVLSDKTKKITAYHEGGHALTALFTEGSPEIRKATLIPRGDALGMVNFLESDEMMVSKKEFLGRIAMAMGGRVAEELIFGADNVSSGASSDFQSATNIALMMVTKFGMSEKVGPVSISKDGFKGDGKVIEEEVRAILTSSYETAKSILTAKDKELHLIADALLKYETLDKDEILKVIQGEKLTEKEAKLKKEKEEMEEKKKKRLEAETKKAEEKKAKVEEETKQALEELKKGLSKHQIQVPEFPTILKTQIHQ